ncbi:MAG: PAS domain-containing protein [Cyclobacteriaceae bacterium]|jgi:PAS domain-containing protein
MIIKDSKVLLGLLYGAAGINILFDLDFKVIQTSKQTGHLLGAKPDDLIGKNLYDAPWSKWESKAAFLKVKKQLLKEVEENGFSSQTLIQKGHDHEEVHYLLLSDSGELNAIWSCIHIANSGSDSREAMFETLMNNIPHRVYFKDVESRFLDVNKAMVEGHGYTSA